MSWTADIIRGVGLWDQLDRYDDIGGYIESELGTLENNVKNDTAFTPFGVSGQFGNTQIDSQGNINYTPEARESANALARQFQGDRFFDDAAGGYDEYSQGMFDKAQAMLQPQQQRMRSEVEQRLAAQGRDGMIANQYGGSPEMLAMEKAFAEQNNAAAFQAIGAGQRQQMQDAQLGGMFQNAQYMPQAQMQNMFNQGLQGAQLKQAGQIAGANNAGQIGLGRINANVNNEAIRAKLMGDLFQQVGATAQSNNWDGIFGDFWNNLWS
jgi:hypothetical protein